MNKKLVTFDSEHVNMINDAQMDYYGKMMATCSSDNTICVYTEENGATELLMTIKKHTGPVWRLSWSHPSYGSLLASCSYDGSVNIYSLSKDKTYNVEYTYMEHQSSVNCVAWAPSEYGAMLMTASSDGNISCIYKTECGWQAQLVAVCRMGCSAVSWCPYRPIEKDVSPTLRVVVAAGDNSVCVLRCFGMPPVSWTIETKLRGHTNRVRDVVWCSFIGAPGNIVASCGRDREVRIWREAEEDQWSCCFSHNYTEAVWRVSWSVTGNLLVVSHGSGGVDMWKENLDHSWRLVNRKSEQM